MSKEIDWSKAPDSAMVLLKHVRDNRYAWAVSHADESDAWMVDGTCFGFRLMANCWRVVSNRPTTPSWSGEGLPPVGVVCEYNPMPIGKPKKWHKVEVVYASEWVIVMRCIEAPNGHDGGNGVEIAMAVDSCSLEDVRPIRTPEQIAADEREAAIEEMHVLVGDIDQIPTWDHALGTLYDAGYRKP